MAESSLFWTDSTGDGGPYSQSQIATWLERLFQTDQAASEGVVKGDEDELAVSGTSTPVSVAAGSAMVKGRFYRNTAAVDVSVVSPSVSTRIDRIVLQADWTAQTVRIAKIDGVEGGAAPALTQTDGVTWEISLAQISTTTGGVITVTDEREFCHFGTRVDENMLDASVAGDGLSGGAGSALEVNVDDSTIEINSDALRVKNSGIVEAKIAAGAVTETKLGNGAVSSLKLAVNSVVAAKIAVDQVDATHLAHAIDATGIGFDADKVDGYDVVAVAAANKVLALNGDGDLPADITGDADTVDGYHAGDIIAGGVLVGMIVAWYGTLGGSDGHRPTVSGTPNEDWHVCNGETVGGVVTPDLQGRMIVGVGGTLGASMGDAGGAVTKNLAHTHSDGTLSVAPHYHVMPGTDTDVSGSTQFVASGADIAVSNANHTHYVDSYLTGNAAPDVTGNTGSALSASENIMNPYRALYWLMKVA